MTINPEVIYQIGEGGLIDSKLIFKHPYKLKKRPWVALCVRDAETNKIERIFLDGYKEHFDDDHYLIEFDINAYEIYHYGNIYLGNNTIEPDNKSQPVKWNEIELYKSYCATTEDDFVEIEQESVLVFMSLNRSKKKNKKTRPVYQNYVPDDIDF